MQTDIATRYPMLARYQDKSITTTEAVSSIAPGNNNVSLKSHGTYYEFTMLFDQE